MFSSASANQLRYWLVRNLVGSRSICFHFLSLPLQCVDTPSKGSCFRWWHWLPTSRTPVLTLLALSWHKLALDVPLIPEHAFAATMWDDVIGNRLAFAADDALAPGTGSYIPHQDRPPQLLPAAGLVPFAPGLGAITYLVPGLPRCRRSRGARTVRR